MSRVASRARPQARKFLIMNKETKRAGVNRVSVTIQAGLASASPPLGPILGNYALNIAGFCKDFNERTKHMKQGIPLSCVLFANPDRTYKLVVMKPTPEYYLMQAAGIERARLHKEDGVAGRTTIKHIYEIAKILHADPDAYYQLDSLEDVCKQMIATAKELGIEIVRELNAEEYKQFLEERMKVIEEFDKMMQEIQEAKLARTA